MSTDFEIAKMRAEMQEWIEREQIDVLGPPPSKELAEFTARILNGAPTPADIRLLRGYAHESAELQSSPKRATARRAA